MNFKLGKHPRKYDPKGLKLSRYINWSTLPTPPSVVDATAGVSQWPMYGNDKAGDCTCAAMGHLEEIWRINQPNPVDPTDAEVVGMYSAVTGYNPTTGANDNGANMVDILNYCKNTGFAGDKIGGFAAIDFTDQQSIMAAMYLFRGVYLGVGLPDSVLPGDTVPPWTVSAPPNPNNGHCINIAKADIDSLCEVVTWGQLLPMSWQFLDTDADEAYAIFTTEILKNNIAPSGFDQDQLISDLAALSEK